MPIIKCICKQVVMRPYKFDSGPIAGSINRERVYKTSVFDVKVRLFHYEMVIILQKKLTIESKSSGRTVRNATKYKIDPNSISQSHLPGDHQHYSHILSECFGKWVDHVQNFEIRADDVWIIGLPKTGTTWVHNIAFKLQNGLDYENIANELEDRFFERLTSQPDTFDKDIERFKNMASPRVFKSHLPAFLLPKALWTVKPKIIYTIRNPKDMVISRYHMIRNSMVRFPGTLTDFADHFFNDTGFGTPIFDHIHGFLQLRCLDNVLLNVYEDLVADPFQGIKRVCVFLACPHTSKQLHELTENVSFGKMRDTFPSFMMPMDRTSIPDPDYR